MTKAQESYATHHWNGELSVVEVMSIHAQEFAEWCSRKGWVYDTIDFWEHKISERKTTSELYTLFNNQNK